MGADIRQGLSGPDVKEADPFERTDDVLEPEDEIEQDDQGEEKEAETEAQAEDKDKTEDSDQKKTDRKTEPPPNHPRFAQVYRKQKDTERKLSETGRKLDEALAQLSQLNHRQTTVEKKDFDTRKGQLESSLQDALASNDLTEYHRINTEYLALLGNLPAPPNKNGAFTPDQIQQGERDLNAFKTKFDWYDNDMIKTGYALKVERDLRRDPDSASLTNRQFLFEIGRRVDLKFNASSNKGDAPTDGVGKNETPSSTESLPVLTDDQKHVAMMTFTDLPEKDRVKAYAKELLAIQKARRK